MKLLIRGKVSFLKVVKQGSNDNGEVIPSHQKVQFAFIDGDRGHVVIEVKDLRSVVSSESIGKEVEIPVLISHYQGKTFYRVA